MRFVGTGVKTIVMSVPPPRIVVQTIAKIIQCKAKGVLVVPLWFTAHYFLSICMNGTHLNRMFLDFDVFYPVFFKGPDVKSFTFSGYTKFPMIALLFDGAILYPDSSNFNLKLTY